MEKLYSYIIDDYFETVIFKKIQKTELKKWKNEKKEL